jgi:hypothetical protein
MLSSVQSFRIRARAEAEELLVAIEGAESIIVSTIERECEALRAGRLLAAQALRARLRDAARLYINAARAARASLATIEVAAPGTDGLLEERRVAFSALLRIELAVLAAERAAAGQSIELSVAPVESEDEAAPRSPKSTARMRLIAGGRET